ncbi:hypothetical protein KC19_5G070700 [Ceratodon purpureus]|uniref:Uncharacterized protein n=1 Tax=Ceratodon purpureus TaxID=3225 RepID=A0A8T0I158_CERPU|nr:hypothetical protein KC19_5G070700 [Ceratodon purpureus]
MNSARAERSEARSSGQRTSPAQPQPHPTPKSNTSPVESIPDSLSKQMGSLSHRHSPHHHHATPGHRFPEPSNPSIATLPPHASPCPAPAPAPPKHQALLLLSGLGFQLGSPSLGFASRVSLWREFSCLWRGFFFGFWVWDSGG